MRRRDPCRAARKRPAAGGLTLLELLIVIAILGVLAALAAAALGTALQYTRSVQCIHHLKQMAFAARCYIDTHEGYFPISYYTKVEGGRFTSYAWDYTTVKDWDAGGRVTVEPGILWQAIGDPREIQQCPSFEGSHNWLADPFTGYNYNASYLGHGEGESIPTPAHITQVRSPKECALFGDAGYGAGANKFMRAPFASPGDAGFSGRWAGTQAFRHLGRTNVVFVDGHAESLDTAYRNTYPSDAAKLAPGTGFLSPDNSLYDLE